MDGINEVKSLTLFAEYIELASILKEEEQKDFYFKIIQFVFYDIEPSKFISKQEEVIWKNLIRPIKISKQNSLNGIKGGRPQKSETETEIKSELKTETESETESTYMSMSMSNSKCNLNSIINNCFPKNHEEIITKPYKQIIDHLNKIAGTHYKYTSKKTQDKIKARLNEGFTLDDFIVVIDKKFWEWKGTDFEQYMRPETLFGNKFESYLNQPAKKITTKDIKLDDDFYRDVQKAMNKARGK